MKVADGGFSLPDWVFGRYRGPGWVGGDFEAKGAELADVVGDLAADVALALVAMVALVLAGLAAIATAVP